MSFLKYEMKREIYPIELIRSGILFLDNVVERRGKYNAIRSLILYTFEDCGDKILPLNREYKPIGLSYYEEWVNYKDFEFLKIPKDMLDFDILLGKKYVFDDSNYPRDRATKKRYKKIVNSLFKDIFKNETQSP